MKFEIGEVIQMKKLHACGGNEWIINRVGADFKIRCVKCGREVMLPRTKFERMFVCRKGRGE